MPLPWSRFPELGDVRSIEASRRRLRFWLTVLAVVLAGFAVLAVALAPKFERNLSARSVREAQVLLEQQDYQRARLVLEQTVLNNPGDLDARRELARFYGDAGSPRALALWRELVQLAPKNDANRLELAYWGVRAGDLATARDALAGLSPAGRSGAAYHRLAAAVALRAGDQKALARELTDLAILEPDTPHAQFNRAVVQLNGGDPTEVGLAREQLTTLARSGPLRIRATLALISAAQGEGDAGYQALAEAVLPPRPRFTQLVSWSAPPRGLLDLISYMQAQPQPEAADAARLADWMRRQGLVPEAASWLNALSPATQQNQAVLAVRARCLVQLRDWRGLENALRQGVWGRASDDALDLAFAAQVQRSSNHADHARDTWGDALDTAGTSVESLHVLLRLADEVGWTAAAEATLQRLVLLNPHDAEAWQGLAAIALAQGASGKLYALYDSWCKADPESLEARSGETWIAAVVRRNWPAAGEADEGLRETPGWAAAHALALHAEDRDREALEGLGALSAGAQADRRVALIRGVLLAGRSRREESERALAIGAAGPLLPEENALVLAARARNGTR